MQGNSNTGKPVKLDGIEPEEFYYYYLFWEDFHVLKVLPHGQGTLAERRWLIDLLKIFEKNYTQIEILQSAK